ncbi:MAG TPA: glycosyl hydrolase [Pasteurellaceae bacterium]|nr:glycosyl hydrolase [Pasteurellaceae bacterium]
MKNNLQLFVDDFNKVKELGFIPSNRSNSTGIGKTFEDVIGVVENNATEPDLHGFELKSHRNLSESYVTLFTKAPTIPKGANTYLRVKYGSSDNEFPNIKVLHTSIFHGRFNSHIAGAKFSLEINYKEERVYIVVQRNDGSFDKSVYYSFDSLKKALFKLNNLAYVSADTRRNGNVEEFHFTNATIFSEFKGLEHFLKMIEFRLIMYDVRIGAYKKGDKIGKTHDHGSGFRIKKENMKMLYEHYIKI